MPAQARYYTISSGLQATSGGTLLTLNVGALPIAVTRIVVSCTVDPANPAAESLIVSLKLWSVSQGTTTAVTPAAMRSGQVASAVSAWTASTTAGSPILIDQWDTRSMGGIAAELPLNRELDFETGAWVTLDASSSLDHAKAMATMTYVEG